MGCITGKQSYATKALAGQALAMAQLYRSDYRRRPKRYFLCEHCGRYHLTSQEKRK